MMMTMINIFYSLLNVYEQIRHDVVLCQSRAHSLLLSDGEADSLMVHLETRSVKSHWGWVTSCGHHQQNDGIGARKQCRSCWCEILHLEQIKNPQSTSSVTCRACVYRDSGAIASGKLSYTHFCECYKVTTIQKKSDYFFQINLIHLYICHI